MYNPNINYFRNKTVVISGSSKGIGKTLARELGLMGAHIVINGTNSTTLAEAEFELRKDGIDVISVAGNVASMDDCNKIADAALAKFGSIDLVFANAGMSSMGSVEETDANVFNKIIEVNFLGVIFLIKACLPALKISKGSIMITGSASGIRGIPGAAVYSASKMALTALAESLRIELCPYAVHVCLAYVGFTENDNNKMMLNEHGELVTKQKVARGNVASKEHVATKMIEMIQERTHSKVFSAMGRLNFIVNRFAPWLSHIIFKQYYLSTLQRESNTKVASEVLVDQSLLRQG